MKCDVCQETVRRDFRSQVRHIVDRHPVMAARIIVRLSQNGEQVGAGLAEYVKQNATLENILDLASRFKNR
jgi:hypothetical protein